MLGLQFWFLCIFACRISRLLIFCLANRAHFKLWEALGIRWNKKQHFEISHSQHDSALWNQFTQGNLVLVVSEKKTMGNVYRVTFEIRFIQWWLDLGVGSNPSLPGTRQLLIKVKYNVRPKATGGGCKTFSSKENSDSSPTWNFT